MQVSHMHDMTFGPDGQQHQSRGSAEALRCTTNPELIPLYHRFEHTIY